MIPSGRGARQSSAGPAGLSRRLFLSPRCLLGRKSGGKGVVGVMTIGDFYEADSGVVVTKFSDYYGRDYVIGQATGVQIVAVAQPRLGLRL